MKATLIDIDLTPLSSAELEEINGGDCPSKAGLKDSFFSTVGCGLAVVKHKMESAWDRVKSWF